MDYKKNYPLISIQTGRAKKYICYFFVQHYGNEVVSNT
jgi:hypothetical protein